MLKFRVFTHIFTFWSILAWALTLLTHRQQGSYNRSYWAFVGFIVMIFWLEKRKNKKGRWKHSPVHTPTGSQPERSDSDVMPVILCITGPMAEGGISVSPSHSSLPAAHSLSTSGTGPPLQSCPISTSWQTLVLALCLNFPKLICYFPTLKTHFDLPVFL